MQVESNIDDVVSTQSNIRYLSNTESNNIDIRNDVMKIYVFQPYKCIRYIKLYSHNSISVLYHIYPAGSIFIFKGQILNPQNSFKYYQIIHNSKIVVIPTCLKESNPGLIEKWQNETLDFENFEYKINLHVNKSNRNELARINDINFLKKELKKKSFGSKRKFIISNKYENINNQSIKLNVDYEPLDSPSCEPLPIFLKIQI